MSLVEKAIKKIQESAAPAAPQRAQQSLAEDRASRPDASASQPGLAAPSRAQRSRATARSVKVNLAAIRGAGLLPPAHQERLIADQYRQIKRPLIAAAMHRGKDAMANGHLIAVTSALPGDGKTFTSINLALSMANDRDISVLLIDGDVAKRHLSDVFGIAGEPGLVDALQDEAVDVEALIHETDVPGLSLLAAGSRAEHVNEMLASARMKGVVASLAAADATRIVLIDTPPLLLTSESRVIAQHAGQVVMVVRADKTPQNAVVEALGYLEGDKAVGLVLNQSLDAVGGYYYGYGESGEARP